MRVMRLTSLVVFVAAVFLTFVGSNQLITNTTKNEPARPAESAANISIEPNSNITADNAPEMPTESAAAPGKSAKPKRRSARRNGPEYNVWQDHNGGKWVMESKWDGEKWVTKRVYYPSNKE